MARIAGVTLPNKRLEYALQAIHGIGLSTAQEIVSTLKLDASRRMNDLTDEEVNKLREMIEKTHRVEGDLRRDVLANIKRLKEIGSYRGSRHTKHLTSRGQRTKTNSRTVRGNVRKTMGSGRRLLTKT